jgi:hypothetical protein
MRRILSERSLVVVLFVLVFITFVFAQQDSKKMEKGFSNINGNAVSAFMKYQAPSDDAFFLTINP